MKVIVAGYSGLIGSAITKALLPECDVVRAGRSADADMALDLSQPEALSTASFLGASHFIHAAGVVDEELQENPKAAIVKSTIKTEWLIDKICNAGMEHMVYISSAHVYGALEGTIAEEMPPNPLSMYALLHYSAEQIIRRAVVQGRLRSATILRPCAVFGMPPDASRFRRWSLIPYSFLQELSEAQQITLKSSGLQERNFVDAATVAACVKASLEHTKEGIAILNPLGAHTMSVLAFAKHCVDVYMEVTKKHGIVSVQSSSLALPPPPLVFTSSQQVKEAASALEEYLRSMILHLHTRQAA